MKKRFWALFLAVMMIVSVLPTTAFAGADDYATWWPVYWSMEGSIRDTTKVVSVKAGQTTVKNGINVDADDAFYDTTATVGQAMASGFSVTVAEGYYLDKYRIVCGNYTNCGAEQGQVVTTIQPDANGNYSATVVLPVTVDSFTHNELGSDYPRVTKPSYYQDSHAFDWNFIVEGNQYYPYYLMLRVAEDTRTYTVTYNWGNLASAFEGISAPEQVSGLKRNASHTAASPDAGAVQIALEDGYVFGGWKITGPEYAANASVAAGDNVNVTGDLTLTAIWNECTHKWSDWAESKEPTCEDDGEKTRECSICGATQTQPVDALGHDMGEWYESKAPTCVAKGEEKRDCQRKGCDHFETREIAIDEDAHDMGEWYESKAPTCTEKGEEKRDCQRKGCDHFETREIAIDEDAHDMGEWYESEAPTCVAKGEEKRDCQREGCNHFETREIDIDEDAHDMGEWYESKAPTCTEKGEEKRDCQREGCNHFETREIDIDEDAHEWGEWEVTTEPTCTTPGEETRICKLNDKHFETRPVDAKGHTWDDNWVDNGDLTETRTCSNNVCTETRDIDKKGKLDGGKEIGDGIADKYQVFVWYKAGANGSLTGEIYKAYTLGKEGDAELLKEVTLTYPTTVPYSGYAFDKWILPAQVTINGTTMSNFQVGTTYTFTATFGTDNKGNLDGDKETGDGTPDKYQVFVWYKAGDNGSLEGKTYYAYDLRINGTTELRFTVSLNYPTPVARHGFDFDGWLEPADVVISEDTMRQFTVGETYVFTAMFSRDRGDRPVAEPTVKVKGLNSDDHVAYVVGRGEGMFDPMGKVTRAEVATIYFRLMTEEFRTEFWTDVNSFSDVVGTDWYNVAISTLENAGVIQDTVTGGEFRPNDPITRAELAVMAAQFATVTGKIPETSFKDVDKDYWAYDEIKLIECAGWIEGYRGYFRPDDNLTRAECVTIVNRMLKRGAEEDNMLEDMVIFLDNLDQDMWYYEAIQEAANSHDYTRTKVKLEGENFNGEIWTVLLDAPDWAALEQAWSQAHVE